MLYPTLADRYSAILKSSISIAPVEAARENWRKLAHANDANLMLIEVICTDEQIHKQRIEARVRNIEGKPEITWERVLERKCEYEPWPDERLILDSVENSDSILEKALEYIHRASS